MCGIIGYVGNEQAGPIILEGLRKLEYRGYDSAGFCTVHDTHLHLQKDAGALENMSIDLESLPGTVGIAHSRWSTHGPPTKINAHPHATENEKIALVHNGIIENYLDLKKELAAKGHAFLSDTDSEIIVHLIEDAYAELKDFEQAVLSVISQLDGSFALAIVCADEPQKMIALRKESPLVVGCSSEFHMVASDVPALLNHTNEVMYLANDEIAILSPDGVVVKKFDGTAVDKERTTTTLSSEGAEKSGYEHFMLKEIHQQPAVIADTLHGRIGQDGIVLEKELGALAAKLGSIKRIVMVACGTSWHAALTGEFMIEELARVPVEVEYASEFRYRNPIVDESTLVIAISQSGETADTLAAIQEAKGRGAPILSIINVPGSSMERESDAVLYTHAGSEIGVASTKAFTTQLVVLYVFTLYLAQVHTILSPDIIKELCRKLKKLPLQMRAQLGKKKHIGDLVDVFSAASNALFLGRGVNFPLALEGALKLKEVSYIHAEGYPAAEMKHGPIALIDENMPVVVIATKDQYTYKKILGNIQEVKARKGIVIAIVTEGDETIKEIADYYIEVPDTLYILSSILTSVPLQLLAYHVAVDRKLNPDKPRNLAKAVTVE